jgi:hypothetical protein
MVVVVGGGGGGGCAAFLMIAPSAPGPPHLSQLLPPHPGPSVPHTVHTVPLTLFHTFCHTQGRPELMSTLCGHMDPLGTGSVSASDAESVVAMLNPRCGCVDPTRVLTQAQTHKPKP